MLTGCDVERYSALIEGSAEPEQFVTVALLEGPASGSEEPSVEPVKVEPPRCDDYLYRAQWFDCHGNYLRDMD
jgi:hypothetical protein